MIGLIKLSTGEELVGEIEDINIKGNITTVIFPLRIIYKQNVDGLPITFVTRYQLFSKENNANIFNNHIISICEARPSFVEYYKDAIKYYDQSESNIDKQLLSLVESSNSEYEDILNSMPKNTLLN